MDGTLQAEDHDVVTRLDACVAVNELSLAVTHEAGYGEVAAQFQVLDIGASHAVAFLDDNFGYLGIGKCQATGVVLVGINHDLIDAA